MGTRLKLKVPLLRFLRILTRHCAVDVDRKRVVPFNDIRAITVHLTHGASDRRPHNRVQPCREPIGGRGKFDGDVFQLCVAVGKQWSMVTKVTIFAAFYAVRFHFRNIAIGCISSNHIAGIFAGP